MDEFMRTLKDLNLIINYKFEFVMNAFHFQFIFYFKLVKAFLFNLRYRLRACYQTYNILLGIVLVLLYGYEDWSRTLLYEIKFRVFENNIFRAIFRAARYIKKGVCRIQNNAEIHDQTLKSYRLR